MPGVIAEPQHATKARKPTKNEQRRARKKQQKLEANVAPALDDAFSGPTVQNSSQPPAHIGKPTRDVSGLTNLEDISPDHPLFAQYASVVAKFQQQNEEPESKDTDKPEVLNDDDDKFQDEEEEEETKKKLGRKARKQAGKLSVAELKAIVRRPELVEWNDTDAREPRMLVNIKTARNVVPVPRHWSLKREYLSSKRGIEKQHWVLPKFIAETGVAEMRDAVLEKQENATLKQKQRDRVSGKTGSLTLDYNKLYEAFFRRQTKPELTRYGEVYYEGKEYETNLHHLQPGQISDELREALNMGIGAPPPWLLTQQRIGPPPSYPALRVPGVNAPIPPYAQWGMAPGCYGKPPVDEQGRPLWGGNLYDNDDTQEAKKQQAEEKEALILVPKELSMWGELQPLPDVQEEEEEEDEDDEDDAAADGDVEVGQATGVETYGEQPSVTPNTDFIRSHTEVDDFDLRKARYGTEEELAANLPRSAGQVLHQKSIRAEGFFGGDRAYDLSGTQAPPADMPMLGSNTDDRGRKRKATDLDVSIDVDQIESGGQLTKEQLRQQYEAQRSGQGGSGWQDAGGQEDFSGLVAEETAKRQKREKERERDRKGRK